MKPKKPNIELLTDEEILNNGATKQSERVLNLTLRPITIRTLSQMKRNGILNSENSDVFQKTAAFGFLHSADKEDIDAVVSNKDKFLVAVDDWMDENFTNHNQMEPLAEAMNQAFEEYSKASSSGETPYKGNGSKN